MTKAVLDACRTECIIGLISYSEATRYTKSKRLEAEKWCAANSKALGQHLLYPRNKGFVASVRKLRETSHVKAVYDITISYAKDGKLFQEAPSFWQTLCIPRLKDRWRFYVHIDRHDLRDLPAEEAQLAKWLEDRWVEKGERLEKLRAELSQGKAWLTT